MSARYAISGGVRFRRCPEVQATVAKIREHCDPDFTVSLVPRDAEVDEFSIEGAGQFPVGCVRVLDELLESLGPYTLEAAVLTGEYENEPCELVVAPTAEASAIALSHHRLEQIKPLLPELSTQDRQALAALLREPDRRFMGCAASTKRTFSTRRTTCPPVPFSSSAEELSNTRCRAAKSEPRKVTQEDPQMPRTPHPWQRKGRGWYGTINGKQVPLGKDEQAVRIEFNRLMVQKRKASKSPISRLTVKELLDAWIDREHGAGRAGMTQRTRKHDGEVARSFIAFVGQLEVSQLEESHLLNWLDSHPELSKGARASAASTIKLAFQWAAEQGLMSQSPFSSLDVRSGDLAARAPGISVKQLRLGAEGNRFRLILDLVLRVVSEPEEARSSKPSGLPVEEITPSAEPKFCPRCGSPIRAPGDRQG